MRCCICNRLQDLAVCEWPTPQLVIGHYGELEVGDLVRRFNDFRDRAPAVVATVEHLNENFVRVVLRIGKREKGWTAMKESLVRVVRPTACGALCCERHRVDRDGRIYCIDHSQSWEQVA